MFLRPPQPQKGTASASDSPEIMLFQLDVYTNHRTDESIFGAGGPTSRAVSDWWRREMPENSGAVGTRSLPSRIAGPATTAESATVPLTGALVMKT